MPKAHQWKIIPSNPFFNIWVHKFTKDDGPNLHDHAWANVSIILKGAYKEFTPDGVFERKRGNIIFRRSTDRHRIEILEHPCWSLFITGPEIRYWREYPYE